MSRQSFYEERLGHTIYNFHDRVFEVPPEKIGLLIDQMALPGNALWPVDEAGPLVLDRPLSFGARGGHGGGRINYTVVEHLPGRRVMFRFDNDGDQQSDAIIGIHYIEALSEGARHTRLRYVLNAEMRGAMLATWTEGLGKRHDAAVLAMFERLDRYFFASSS